MSAVKLIVSKRETLSRNALRIGHVYRGVSERIIGHTILVVAVNFSHAKPQFSRQCVNLDIPSDSESPVALSWSPWFPEEGDEFELLGPLEVSA